MNLQEEYKEETNKNAIESIGGWLAFTDNYVEWLEAKILQNIN